jgi:hypothetical protein
MVRMVCDVNMETDAYSLLLGTNDIKASLASNHINDLWKGNKNN